MTGELGSVNDLLIPERQFIADGDGGGVIGRRVVLDVSYRGV